VTGHIITYTGKLIEPLSPDSSLICIEDIAHALSNCCRFCGHVRRFYAVAQHSVLVSQIVPPELAFVGLMHDASEAYLSDIASPIKRQPEFGYAYKVAETRLMHAIAERFGFEWPPPREIHRADKIALRSEQRDLMPPSPDLLAYKGEFLDERIRTWTPTRAEFEFLGAYRRLTLDEPGAA
jgi:hypothetical protein